MSKYKLLDSFLAIFERFRKRANILAALVLYLPRQKQFVFTLQLLVIFFGHFPLFMFLTNLSHTRRIIWRFPTTAEHVLKGLLILKLVKADVVSPMACHCRRLSKQLCNVYPEREITPSTRYTLT